jgi:hypothetical protein
VIAYPSWHICASPNKKDAPSSECPMSMAMKTNKNPENHISVDVPEIL